MLGYWILYGQVVFGFLVAVILIWALKRDKIIQLEGGKQKKLYGSIQHPADSFKA